MRVNSRNLRFLAAIGLSAAMTIVTLAMSSARPPTAAGPEPTPETITYESGPAQFIDKTHEWRMTGGVALHQGKINLETQAAVVNLDQNLRAITAQSTGPVHLYNEQDDLTAGHGNLDFRRHLAVLSNHIALTLHAQGAVDSRTHRGVTDQTSRLPTTLTCESITYDYANKLGTIPGRLTVFQGGRVLTAEMGEYDGKAKTVRLTGHVHIVQSDGTAIDAPEVRVGVDPKNQWVSVVGGIHGRFKSGGKPTRPSTPTHNAPNPSPAPPPPLALPQSASDASP